MVKATISSKHATALAILVVLATLFCTGCAAPGTLLGDWFESMRGYNSNDATMSNWGNPR